MRYSACTAACFSAGRVSFVRIPWAAFTVEMTLGGTSLNRYAVGGRRLSADVGGGGGMLGYVAGCMTSHSDGISGCFL